MAEILQLAQLVELHGVTQVQIGARRIETLLDLERNAAFQLGDKLGLDEELVGAALEHGQMMIDVESHGNG